MNKINFIKTLCRGLSFLLIGFGAIQCTSSDANHLHLKKDDHIVLVGNNLGSRMMNYGHFETELHLRYPDSLLYIRNMCDGGQCNHSFVRNQQVTQ